MKRRGCKESFVGAKKKKVNDEEAALAELLLLYESGRDVKQLTACKFAAYCCRCVKICRLVYDVATA